MGLRVCGVGLRVWASSSHFCFFFEVSLSFAFWFLPAMAKNAVGKLLGCLVIRKHFSDQVDPEDAYGSSDP